MDNQGGRWGQLYEYSGNPVYDVDYEWDSEERSRSWLLWDPPEDTLEDQHPEIYWANVICQEFGYFDPWKGFETRETGVEVFVPLNYYGTEEERQEELGSTLREVEDSFDGVDMGSPTPLDRIPDAKAWRDEARDRLDIHVRRLNEKVMEPIRQVFIPCAVKATRAIRGFSKDPEGVEDETQKKWIDTIEDLHHLYSAGIGRGIRSEKLREHWYEGKFDHVPKPVVDGVRAALSKYVERSEEKKIDRSRDGILENARPVYFKWEAARRMVWSGLYEWPLNEAVERMNSDPRPVRRAREVFEDKSRPEGSNTENHERVKRWAVDAFSHFYGDGTGAERAKDRVLGIAAEHDYHFSRKSLERWVKR